MEEQDYYDDYDEDYIEMSLDIPDGQEWAEYLMYNGFNR
jgi:hypothetical protein